MIRRPPRSTQSRSSAASDVYKRQALANLAMLTGNVGRPSTGVNPLRGQNNVQGACDVGGLPEFYPGYQRVDDDEAARKFEGAWGRELPRKPGLTLMEMMEAAASDKVKFMYILGENPLVSDPNICLLYTSPSP